MMRLFLRASVLALAGFSLVACTGEPEETVVQTPAPNIYRVECRWAGDIESYFCARPEYEAVMGRLVEERRGLGRSETVLSVQRPTRWTLVIEFCDTNPCAERGMNWRGVF